MVKEQKEEDLEGTRFDPRVVVCMLVSISSGMFLALSSACVQMLEEAIPDWQLNITRNLGTFIFACLIMGFKRSSILVETQSLPLVGISCVFYICSAYFIYTAVNYLPLATANSISMSSNLLLGTVLFRIFLQEKVTWCKVMSIALCLLGILALIQPRFPFMIEHRERNGSKEFMSYGVILTKNSVKVNPNHTSLEFSTVFPKALQPEKHTKSAHSFTQTFIFGYMYTVLHGMAVSSRILTFKALRNKDVDTFVVIFWGSLVGMVVSIIFTLIFETPVIPSSVKEILFILGHGSSIAFRQVTILVQVAYLEAGIANVISIGSGAAFTALFQYTFLKDIMPGHRNVLEVCGIVLVVLGATLTVLMQILKLKVNKNNKSSEKQAISPILEMNGN